MMSTAQRSANIRIHKSEDFKDMNESRGALIMVAGAGGGYIGPGAIYPDLVKELIEYSNIITAQMDYRLPGELNSCVQDLIETIDLLAARYQIQRIVLVGWSFGGAVVISSAAIRHNLVKAIVTIASQTAGTTNVSELGAKGIASLFIHGTNDRCSEQLYRLANQPKELILYDQDNHGVAQHRYEAKDKIKQFTLNHLLVSIK